MIVMQEEEEVVDTKENKRFRATHGEIVAKVRVLVTNLPFSIITKASHYVILNAKVDMICGPTFYVCSHLMVGFIFLVKKIDFSKIGWSPLIFVYFLKIKKNKTLKNLLLILEKHVFES